jgi:hypothetical protein
MKVKRYQDVEEVCYDLQELIDKSGYNLKRTTNKANPAVLTYVCSCVCKKVALRSSNNTTSACNSYKQDSSGFPQVGQNGSNVGLIKRTNSQACDFRINFKRLTNGQYLLRKKFNFNHNHSPSFASHTKVIILNPGINNYCLYNN